MSKRKLDKLKKDAQSKYNPPSTIPFDATGPRDIPDPTWQKPGDREWIEHIGDHAMRDIAWKVLEKEGLKDCDDKTFCRWLRKRGLYTEAALAAYCIEQLGLDELII